ncbi:hypothetical protein ACSBL2_12070 [Pedobacter sp. AW31-3R]|uniref:hypothetical protein n=1 Tax=Pedobacter sp. AW31-3R TaxID=3445781 RepID=UPI003FA0B471
MMKKNMLWFAFVLSIQASMAQDLVWKKKVFEPKNVSASIIRLNGEEVLKVERDLKALPFDLKNLEKTVDEPTYVKLKNIDLTNGTIEVKMLSQIQSPSPFEAAQGFIGLAYRINEDDSAFESIYLRPKVGRSDDQFARNHTVQYFAYPDFKFNVLRQEDKTAYETYADVALNEWITIRIEIKDSQATLFINGQQHPSFIVQKMKGKTTHGQIGLWVDIATIGYFKDLKIIKS